MHNSITFITNNTGFNPLIKKFIQRVLCTHGPYFPWGFSFLFISGCSLINKPIHLKFSLIHTFHDFLNIKCSDLWPNQFLPPYKTKLQNSHFNHLSPLITWHISITCISPNLFFIITITFQDTQVILYCLLSIFLRFQCGLQILDSFYLEIACFLLLYNIHSHSK